MVQLGSRYREMVLLERDAKGDLVTGPVPTPLGVFSEYLNGVKLYSVNLNHTGIVPTPSFKRTWDQVHPGPPYLTGGPFSSVRVVYPRVAAQAIGTYSRTVGNTKYEYKGGFYLPLTGHDPVPLSTLANMGWNPGQDSTLLPDTEADYGSQVFGRLRPQLSDGGLGVALAEMRDTPRMLKTTAKGFAEIWRSLRGHPSAPFMAPKKAADHFLNQEFGWIPFLNDVEKFADNVANGEFKINQLARDNNAWVRRRRTLYQNTTGWNTDYYQWGFPGCQPNGAYLNLVFPSQQWAVYSRLVDSVWASGAFKYYRPELDKSLPSYDDMMPAMRRQMLLHGARLNPSVLWRATPWTWLIDWGLGVGKLIDNMEAIGLDGVVSKYLYLMQHTRREIISEHVLSGHDGDPVVFTWPRSYEVKQRMEASNPYGFGLSWSGLSPMKLAILAALGISRKG